MRQTAVPKGVIPVPVPRRPHLVLPVALALALGLLLAACGSGDDEVVSGGDTGSVDTTSPDTGVTSVTLDGGGGGTTVISWERIEPTEDLVGPTVTEPTELLVDPDDDSVVLVHFYGGVQDCYGARATADESDDAVEITLETGSRADAGDRACIEIAQAQELAVELDAPLGDRELTAAS